MAFSIQDYEIIDEIGTGAFGTVFRARQKALNRIVALKCLSPQRTQNRDDILRFQREAQAMAALSHDSIVSIFDYGFQAGSYYIVMQYIDGVTFEEALDKKITLDQSLFVVDKIIQGLENAHQNGIIHRDIKPANILLGRNGEIKLADFGLSAIRLGVATQSAVAAVGTLSYMSPETMVNPKDIDERADIYSLGCVLYQLVSGKVPFYATSIAEASYKVLNTEVKPLSVSQQYQSLANCICQCLQKQPQQRPTLTEISEVIKVVLGEAYHSTGSDLCAFLQKDNPPATELLRTNESEIIAKNSKKSEYKISKKIILASAIGILGAVIILISSLFLRQQKKQYQWRHSTFFSSSTSTLPSNKKDERQPVPITEDMGVLATGVITLHNLFTQDSVYIDGNLFYISEKKTAKKNLQLQSGQHTISVRSAEGEIFSKNVHCMPYQQVEWYLPER